jgi:hypothetical protein
MLGWLLRLSFMPRWIGRTKWFKRRYCLCGQQAQQRALKQGRRITGRIWQ